ncbi:MAG TPA: cytochrome c oxidase subunit II [Blastocatellia bacterium]|nr:cytochrome c oxidase subunit II [Blastocatellia bacterium]
MTERPGMAPALRDVGIDQRLNEQVPLNLAFRDETGRDVTLRDCVGTKPAVLALVYYECPMLCNEVLTGLTGALKAISFDAGDEFNVIAVSFNPRETADLARAKKEGYVARYGREGTDAGWHFLTGTSESIDELTRAAGFRYSFDPATNQYAHASAIMVLTPQGRLSHYFYGIDYPPRDLRLALVEASSGKIGSPVDQVLLYCYHYDPTTGKYGAVVMNMLRLGGLATLAGIALLVLILRRRNRNREGAENAGAQVLYCSLPVAILQLPLLPERASTFAGEVDGLYLFLVALSVFFSVLISGAIIYFAIRYRRRSRTEIGSGLHGSIKLELAWSVIPFVIAMGIFVWGARVYFSITRPPSEALEIYGIGKQWMWKFQHPDGQREVNELHVPVGRNVKVTIATEDVIHSFFVPAFRVKADVVPGRLTTIWFKATKPGRYHLFCAEYCGNQHSGMIGWVDVMEPTDYQAWLTGAAPEGTMAQAGEKLFAQFACNNCHRKEPGGRGPVLEGVFGKEVLLDSGRTIVADEGYVRESIFNPQAKVVAGYNPVMPNFKGLVSEEQLLQLIAYIKSLTPQKPGAVSGQAGAPATSPAANANRPATQRQNRTR